MLKDDERSELVRYRIERAYRVLEEANDVAGMKHWNLASNRLYYAVFHICQALLISYGISSRSHAGLIHQIGEHFVMTGLLPKEYGRLIALLYELRQSGDYNDRFDATEAEVLPYFPKVKNLFAEIQTLIESKLSAPN